MRGIWKSVAALTVFALFGILGAASAWWIAGSRLMLPDLIVSGQWITSPVIGSRTADPWTRAYIARVGLLALPRHEALYFETRMDVTGAPLNSAKTYDLRGAMPDVGWWSVTAYGADEFLMPVPDAHYSVNSFQYPGAEHIHIGPNPPGTDTPWVATSGDQSIALVLRFYHPPSWDDSELSQLALPTVSEVMP